MQAFKEWLLKKGIRFGLKTVVEGEILKGYKSKIGLALQVLGILTALLTVAYTGQWDDAAVGGAITALGEIVKQYGLIKKQERIEAAVQRPQIVEEDLGTKG